MRPAMDVQDQWFLVFLKSRVDFLGFQVIGMNGLEIFMQEEIFGTEGRDRVQLFVIFQVEKGTKCVRSYSAHGQLLVLKDLEDFIALTFFCLHCFFCLATLQVKPHDLLHSSLQGLEENILLPIDRVCKCLHHIIQPYGCIRQAIQRLPFIRLGLLKNVQVEVVSVGDPIACEKG